MHEIIADLRRDHDFIPLVWECLRDQLFAETVSVRVGCIEQRDTEVERLVHQRDRLALGKISPPTCGNGPQTKTDFADRQFRVFVSAETHEVKIKRSTSNAQHPTLKLK